MKLLRPMALAALLSSLAGGCASYSVYRVSRVRADGQDRLDFPAVFYALPRSVLMVEARITRVTVAAAECAPYRDLAREIGIDESQLALAPRVEFRQSGLRLGERAEPDPDQVFAVRVDDDALRSRTQGIDLSEEGFLTKASVETTSKIEDYVVQTLEVAADITGRALKLFGAGDGGSKAQDAVRKRCVAYKQEFQQLQDRRRDLITKTPGSLAADTLRLLIAQIEGRKGEIVTHFTGTRTIETGTIRCEHTPTSRYGSDSMTAPGFTPSQHRTLYSFSPAVGLSQIDAACTVSEELAPDGGAYAGAWQRALAARFAAQLRTDRAKAELLRRCDDELARGGPNEGILNRVTAQWARELAGRLQEPISRSDSDAVLTGLRAALHTLQSPPLQEATQAAAPPPAAPVIKDSREPKEVVERCDPIAVRAMLDGLDRGGLPVELARAVEGTPMTLWLQVEEPEGQMPAVVAGWQRAPSGEAGFFYRVPGSAVVSLGSDEHRPVQRTRRLIPQFGVVTALAGRGDVRSLAARYALELYPTLGTLQHFSGKTQALRIGETVSAAGRLGNSVLDGIPARGQADPNQELDDIVRRRMILEEQRRIRDLQRGQPMSQPMSSPGGYVAHPVDNPGQPIIP